MGNSTNKKNLQIFPKKITRVAKQSVFSIKLRENLMVYLFNFLSYKDLYKIGKTCIYFNNAFVLKQNKWINSIQPIADKYCFSFTSNDIRNTIDDTLKEHTVFPVNSYQKGLYVQLYEDYIRYYSIAFYFDWAWKTTNSYWRVENIPNAALCDKTPVLINVCYLNTNFCFHHIKEGNYQLYLLHYVSSLSPNKLILKVKIGDREVYSRDFPTKEMIVNCKKHNKELKKAKTGKDNKNNDSDVEDNNKPEGLYNQYICQLEIKEKDIPKKNEGVTVSVEFSHKDLEWKNGWYIHGGYLDKNY